MARRITKKKVEQKRGTTTVFLPDCLEQVQAVAMRGLSDDEMADLFGVSRKLMTAWKKFYPDFAKAIEKGRTKADAKVIESLYKLATGYSHEDTKFATHEGEITDSVTYQKHYPPNFQAIQFWLTNRQGSHWRNRQEVDNMVSGKPGAPPVGVKNEDKKELVSSILALIQPKPDPE